MNMTGNRPTLCSRGLGWSKISPQITLSSGALSSGRSTSRCIPRCRDFPFANSTAPVLNFWDILCLRIFGTFSTRLKVREAFTSEVRVVEVRVISSIQVIQRYTVIHFIESHVALPPSHFPSLTSADLATSLVICLTVIIKKSEEITYHISSINTVSWSIFIQSAFPFINHSARVIHYFFQWNSFVEGFVLARRAKSDYAYSHNCIKQSSRKSKKHSTNGKKRSSFFFLQTQPRQIFADHTSQRTSNVWNNTTLRRTDENFLYQKITRLQDPEDPIL